MRKSLILLLLLLVAPLSLFGDGGVLIPRDKAQPDPAILSLEEMEITIQIDNGNARVYVRQIFANHTPRIEEGNYVFALPTRATVCSVEEVTLPALLVSCLTSPSTAAVICHTGSNSVRPAAPFKAHNSR